VVVVAVLLELGALQHQVKVLLVAMALVVDKVMAVAVEVEQVLLVQQELQLYPVVEVLVLNLL
jgi:hypothetical protein